MCFFANRKHRIKTKRLIQLNIKTGVSKLYNFMTVLKSEIYTNEFFPSKIFSCQSLKERFLLIINCLINLFRKLNKDQKSSTLEIRTKLFM